MTPSVTDFDSALERLRAELGRPGSVSSCTAATLRACRDIAGARAGCVLWRESPSTSDPENPPTLVAIDAFGYSGGFLACRRSVPGDTNPPRPEAARTGRTLFFDNPTEWETRYPLLATLPIAADCVAHAAFPLRETAESDVHGALTLSFANSPTLETIEFLNRSVSACAQTIQRIRTEGPETWFPWIFDNMYQFIGLLAPDGTLLEANQAALNFARVTPAEVLGKPFWEATWWDGDPQRQARLRESVALVARTGTFVRYEVQVRGAANELLWIDFSLIPVFDRAGAVEFIIPEGRDISERKALEKALQDSERRLRDAQSLAQIGSWELDPTTKRTIWSDETWRVLRMGAPGPEPPVADAWNRCLPTDRLMVEAAIHRALIQGEPYAFDIRHQNPDSSIRTLHTTGRPIFGADGTVESLVGTVQNVTEQRRLQHQVFVADKLAAIGRLASGVAHEINNPLAVIAATAELLQKNENADVVSDAETIRKMAWRAHRIIAKLQRLANERRDGAVTIQTRANLNEPVRAALERLGPTLRDHDVELALALDEMLPPVRVDAARFEQVVTHLVNNAVQAMNAQPPATRRLEIHTRHEINAHSIRLVVRDFGPGISDEILPRLFDPFFTTRDIGEGAGLGLAIVQSIVESHGGTVAAESHPDGATFFVTIPV